MSLPNDLPKWAINITSEIEEPLLTTANEGYKTGDKPTAKTFNYVFNRLTRLYNAVINGEYSTGINAQTSNLEYELLKQQNQISELNEKVRLLEEKL